MKQLLEKIFPSLGKKIAVAVILVSVVAGGMFVYFAHRTGYTMLEHQAHAKARGVATILTGILERVMLQGDALELQDALQSVTSSNDIIDAYILRRDGSVAVRAKSGSGYERFPLDKFVEMPESGGARYYTTRENDSLFEYIVAPVVKKKECYTCHREPGSVNGFVAMKFAMDDVRAIALQHRTINILMTVGTFGGLGGILYFALSILVIKPIRRLHAHIRRIEGGVGKLESGQRTRFPLFPEPRANDEIADLCRDFNVMVTSLNDANAKLHELHEVQLEHADRLASTGKIAASIAHEIRNPIAGVLGALQVFDGEVEAGNPRKEILAEMMTQLERVNHTINDLLSYARPAPPAFEPVRVDEVIQKTTSLLSQQFKGNGITLSQDLRSDGAIVSADRKQFQQVLWNVILNAVQASEKTGSVTVASLRENSSVKVTVRDTGKGIPPEQLEKVFTPFFTTKHKGTGLGMTISRRIVEQHGGTIEVASEVGRGTQVTIVIPQQRQQ